MMNCRMSKSLGEKHLHIIKYGHPADRDKRDMKGKPEPHEKGHQQAEGPAPPTGWWEQVGRVSRAEGQTK